MHIWFKLVKKQMETLTNYRCKEEDVPSSQHQLTSPTIFICPLDSNLISHLVFLWQGNSLLIKDPTHEWVKLCKLSCQMIQNTIYVLKWRSVIKHVSRRLVSNYYNYSYWHPFIQLNAILIVTILLYFIGVE